MALSFNWRKIHYWLGLVVVVPVVLWIVTGIGIAVIPRADLNGERESRGVKPPPVSLDPAPISPTALPDLLGKANPGAGQIREIKMLNHALTGRAMYHVRFETIDTPTLIDAQSGQWVAPLSETEAAQIARSDYTGEGDVASVEWISRWYQKGVDYRRELPVYRVNFSNRKQTRIYLNPYTGQIISRRNIYMSAFSVMWNLHIFGYFDRNIAGNVWVMAFGGLALISVFAGVFMYGPYLKREPRS